MLHEKPSESFHWKNKLDNLDHLLEDQAIDKTLAWQKLHDRLRNQPRKRIILWYWTAAALLILFSGIQWLMIEGNDHNLSKHDRQEKPANSSLAPTPRADSFLVPLQMQADKKHIITTGVKSKKQHLSTFHAVGIEKPVVAKIDLSSKPGNGEYSISVSPDSISSNTVPIIAKKKLRVVHINELSEPVEEQFQFVRNNARPDFQRNPLSVDVFPGFAISRNSSDNIIKIQLSPSN